MAGLLPIIVYLSLCCVGQVDLQEDGGGLTTENIPIQEEHTTVASPTESSYDLVLPDWIQELYYEDEVTIEPIEEEVFDLRIISPVRDNNNPEPKEEARPKPNRRPTGDEQQGRRRGRPGPGEEDHRGRGSRRRNPVIDERHRNRRPGRRRRPGDGDLVNRERPAEEEEEDYRAGIIRPEEGPFGERVDEDVEEEDEEYVYEYGEEWMREREEMEVRERGKDRELEEARQRGIGKRLVVTTRLEAPFLNLKQQVQFVAGNDRFEGYLADILEKLAASIGFEYEIRLVRDGKLGSMNHIGVWDGMIGEIERGESDIAAGSLSVTPLREQVVEFTESFLQLRSAALLHKPNRRGNNGQGRIREVDQLLASNMTYGVIQGGESEYFLRHSAEPEVRGMYSRMVNFWPPVFVTSLQAGIERVRTERYAFLVDSPMAEYVANKKPCEFYAIEPFLDLREYAFAMRKGDRLREVIDAELKRLKMTGEMQEMYLRWWAGECNPKKLTTPIPTTTETPWRYATAAQGASSMLLPSWSTLLPCLLSCFIVLVTGNLIFTSEVLNRGADST